MKILVVHNRYLEPGGEDAVVQAEKTMLEAEGHEVILYEGLNAEINSLNFFQKFIFFSKDVFWSKKVFHELQHIINQHKPDVAHFHNIFLALTPSAYDACFQSQVPVVQTLHNYRMLCANGIFFREGKTCEDCLKKGMFSAVCHRCCRKSFFLSWVIIRILRDLRYKKDLLDKVHEFIVLSEFSKRKFVENGFPEGKVVVKPNFVNVKTSQNSSKKGGALFVGRLCDYKGVDVLHEAFQRLPQIPLAIIGEGPLVDKVKQYAKEMDHVEFLGRQSYHDVIKKMTKSACVIFPSACYETFGRVIIEAYACGVPVIVSDAGAAAELVQEEKTGFIFESGNSYQLAQKIQRLMDDHDLRKLMANNAREVYEEKYTEAVNYHQLIKIYSNKILG